MMLLRRSVFRKSYRGIVLFVDSPGVWMLLVGGCGFCRSVEFQPSASGFWMGLGVGIER